MMYVLLRVLPHVFVLIALLDMLEGSAMDFVGLVSKGVDILPTLVANPLNAAVKLVMFPLMLFSIASPTPMKFSLVFVVRSISTMGVDLSLTSRFIPTLLVLSVLDVLSKHYRKGQERYVKYSNLWRSTPLLAVFTAPLVLLPIAVESYVSSLINAVVGAAGRSQMLRLLSANPLFLVAVAVTVGVVIYRSISSLSETIVVFLAKPREFAMGKLTSVDDLDVWFKLPLTSIRNMLLALVFTPPLYYASTIALELIPWPTHALAPMVGADLAELLLKVVLFFIISTIVWRVVAKTFRGPELRVRRILILSAVSLSLLYVLGVYHAARATGFSVSVFLRPDVERVVGVIGTAYLSYYTLLFLILELLLKLLGVVP